MSGNKQELVDRLLAADNTALLDDDLDQDEQISEEAIKAAEEELQKQTDLKLSDDPSPAKKIKISAEVRNLTSLPTLQQKKDNTLTSMVKLNSL